MVQHAPTRVNKERSDSLRHALGMLHAGRYAEAELVAASFAEADPGCEATMLVGLARAGLGDAEQAAALLDTVARRRPEAAPPGRGADRDAGHAT